MGTSASRELRYVFLSMVAAVAIGMTCRLSFAEDAPAGDSTVQMLIVGPDLKPVLNHAVTVSEPYDFPMPDRPDWTWTGTTDDKGQLTFLRLAGMHKLRVVISGVGFGVTGQFEARLGQTVSVPLPPLALVGRVEGLVDRQLLGPDTKVELQETVRSVTTACDAQGHYVFSDVEPGLYSLNVQKAAGDQRAQSFGFAVYPGAELSLKTLKAETPTPNPQNQTTQPLGMANRNSIRKDALWASGVVRDESGHSLQGVEVYAVVSYDGGMRMAYGSSNATTDAHGHYELRGDGPLQGFAGTVVAARPGSAPAFAWITAPPGWDDPAKAQADQPMPGVDLTIPNHYGSVLVHTTADPKATIPTNVSIEMENGPGSSDLSHMGGPDGDRMRSILVPTVHVDANGDAHFERLVPGTYRIAAITSIEQKPSFYSWAGMGANQSPRGFAAGVAVRVGQRTIFDLPIYPQPNQIQFSLLWPDGTPLQNQRVAVEWTPLSGYGWNSSTGIDAQGIGQSILDGPGIWQAKFAFLDTPLQSFPVRGPAYRAKAFVAVYPSQSTQPPIELTATWQDGASVTATIQDIDGTPMRGTVILPGFDRADQAASTDTHGIARFTGLAEGTHGFDAYASGVGPPDLGPDESPLPSDDDLSGKKGFVSQQLNVNDGDQREIVLRPQLLAYVRGQIVPEKGHTPADYSIAWYESEIVPGNMNLRYDKKTGEFVYGPFTAGKSVITVYRVDQQNIETSVPIELKSGQVTHVRIDPSVESPKPQRDEAWLGVGGISMRGAPSKAASCRVVLADNSTPAFGAVAATFVPNTWQSVAAATADVTGQLRPRGLSYSQDSPSVPPPGSPIEPVVVAWLPGAVGATIVPLNSIIAIAATGKPFQIVLPPAISAHGRVTIAGQSVAGRDGRIRVFAAHQGRGKLDQVLSLSVTAQADGSFDLPGLSVGTYQVQAAVDDIWLSPTMTFTVADRGPDPFNLDVPAFGQPVRIHLVDAKGSPVANRQITIDLPKGPLADSLWPSSFHSDGAGIAFVPGLPFGKQVIHFGQEKTSAEISIPPMQPTSPPADITITVPGI